jgi:pyruvate dehydrogenase E2 component (dihydrolipoamide acetyltransferase)
MPVDFTMPKLGLTMEEGTIVEWLVADDDPVEDGAAVLVVMTDKVETEVNVVGSGRLHQLAGTGETLACGARIGVLLAEGEEATTDWSSRPPAASPTAPAAAATRATPSSSVVTASDGRLRASPNARRIAGERGVDLTTVRGTGPAGRIVSEDVEEAAASSRPAPATPLAPAPAPVPTAGGTAAATFAARSLADLLGVDIAAVAPDPDGRVSRDGVATHVRGLLAGAQPAVPATPAVAVAAAVASQTPSRVVPLRGMRGTIAKRMHAALQEMAQLTLTMDAEVDAVVADRQARAVDGTPPGYTDYVVAAVARALRDHPMLNSQVIADGIAVLPDIHVGVAVALDEGLVVPVIRHADRLGLQAIGEETTRLATAARAGKLTLADFEGGTFSVTALGMFGVDAFTPVINPPNAAILGVGRLRDDVVLVDDEVTSRKRITLSLTWDHRVLDGAPAAAFTQSVVAALANPAVLA